MNQRLQNEIEHGEKLVAEGAESTWNWSSPAGQRRADRRAKLLIEAAKITSRDKVLEIGCGTGLFTRKVFEATQAQIVATDLSDALLEQARELLAEAIFQSEDAMNLSFADQTFDVVFGNSVLHHLDFRQALTEMNRVLKPGGRIAFAEPNMLNPQIFIQKNIPFIKKWLGDSPDETAIIRWQFDNLLKKKGFTNIKITPYDFLHPITPKVLVNVISGVGSVIEKIPLLREIAGSVIISAEKSENNY